MSPPGAVPGNPPGPGNPSRTRDLSPQQLLDFVHHPVHLLDGELQRFIRGHVDSRILQELDRVFRASGRQQGQVSLRRRGIPGQDFFR